MRPMTAGYRTAVTSAYVADLVCVICSITNLV
jgi:hypothetical protein